MNLARRRVAFQMTRVWLAMFLLGCERAPSPIHDTDPSRAANTVPGDSGIASCADPGSVEDVVTVGAQLRLCIEPGSPQARTCWAIDREGIATATSVPPRSSLSRNALGTFEPDIITPPGWAVRTHLDDQQLVTAVEVCGPDACSKIPLARTNKLDQDSVVASIAIAPNGKTVAIDRGPYSMGGSRTEIHSITPPRFLRKVTMPVKGCTNVLGYLGDDTLLLQEISRCVDHAGYRALATTDGRIRTVMKSTFDATSPYWNVTGDRWVSTTPSELELWDVSKGKRLAKRDRTGTLGVVDGIVLAIDGNKGAITRYDQDLRPLGGTTLIPICSRP
jgi:hypothetical protein